MTFSRVCVRYWLGVAPFVKLLLVTYVVTLLMIVLEVFVVTV
jgi:hypothetical protein